MFRCSRHLKSKSVAGGRSPQAPLSTGTPWNNVTIRPFPVRAALDIGTGGMITLVVARVDARQHAIRDIMFQTQVPLIIAYQRDSATLTESSRADLRNKVQLMAASMRREGPDVTEAAGLVTYPFTQTDEIQSLVNEFRQAHKIDLRLASNYMRGPQGMSRLERRRAALLRGGSPADADLDDEGAQPSSVTSEDMDSLAFLSYAAAAKIQDKTRLLTLVESFDELCLMEGARGCFIGGALDVVGTVDDDVTRGEAKTDPSSPTEEATSQPKEFRLSLSASSPLSSASHNTKKPQPRNGLQSYRLPLSTLDAHRMLLRDVQRRDDGLLHAFSSPNPVLRQEAIRLRKGLTRALQPSVPDWVKKKLASGALLVGSGENGGLMNIAARLVGASSVGLESLEHNVDFLMCNQTDSLIAHTFPNPHLVVPQGVLCGAMMSALLAPRIEYVPQVSLAHAVLVHEAFWTYSRRAQLQESLSADSWYSQPRSRTFPVPQQARSPVNPNVSPTDYNSRMHQNAWYSRDSY